MPGMRGCWWLAFSFLVVSAPPLQGQRTMVTGSVRSADGPVPGALVEALVADSVRARTEASDEGRFRLVLPTPGGYTLHIRSIGYAERRLDGIEVPASGTRLEVTLDALPYQLNTVIVTALRRTEKALDAPASVTVVTAQQVEERTAITALDHTVGLPGVDVAVQGLHGRQVVGRGFNQTFGTSLLLLSDYRTASIPSLRANLSHFVTPIEEDVERVEVLRGPASALYGPNAADGVVHVITRSPFESQGGSVTAIAGGRSLFEGTLRYARVLDPQVAVKISGKYLRGDEWDAPPVPAELTGRDPLIERVAGEARVDVRPTATGTAVLTVGSTLAMSHVEYTPIGASQVRDWRYDFAQLRYSDRRFFAQVFANVNSAGQTFNLRTLERVYDRSNLIVGQVQHGFDLAGRSRLTYGIDVQRTDPRTAGTINGRNEDDDVSLELGTYAQAETRLSPEFQLVTAARLDHHNRLNDAVFSPRAGLVFSPSSGHRFRLTFNRAFTTPTATDLFLDIRAASLDPLPFSLRAEGVPEQGFHFARDCAGGLCMSSPFAPGQQLPVDATLLWPAVVQILQANGVDLSGLPPPTAADVRTTLRTLDPSIGAFRDQTTAPRDIAPLQPTITNSFELGYKGLLGRGLLLDASVYTTRRSNFRGPLAIETPSVFLNTSDLEAYLAQFMSAEQAQALARSVGGVAADPTATGIPVATVGLDDPRTGSDIVLTYRNFGEVKLWGADLLLEWQASERIFLGASYSFTSDNFFASRRPGEADLALNAPRHKGTLNAAYHYPARDFSAALRGRFVGPFRMVDGVWVGDVKGFGLLDAEVGVGVPGLHGGRFILTVQNLTDKRHAEFVGAPVLGRLLISRLRYEF
jgi:outer membrane receptor for ferrienterochelin and colicins